jgi:hypothetical protein
MNDKDLYRIDEEKKPMFLQLPHLTSCTEVDQ